MVDAQEFRNVMSKFPSGVVVATARDHTGAPRGFTASSFTSVSLSPPLILLCLNRTAECHEVFDTVDRFAVSILKPAHDHVAKLVATRGADKFGNTYFRAGPADLPVVRDALAVLMCHVFTRAPGGDHTILVGQVDEAQMGQGEEAMVHFAHKLWSIGGAAG